MDKMTKVIILPFGNNWKIEILDEAGNYCYSHFEEDFADAEDYGRRLARLYQIEVEILK